MWTLGLINLGRLPAGGGQLTGTPASPGKYEGVVRVVKDEAEFEKIRPGDVLVCVSTTPSWSVVFSVIGALVTEAGGILSHPAIVAREYGIPAVLSLERATEKLREGQRVMVDGDLGAVALVEGGRPK
jgi:pyruvate,water dikinase